MIRRAVLVLSSSLLSGCFGGDTTTGGASAGGGSTSGGSTGASTGAAGSTGVQEPTSGGGGSTGEPGATSTTSTSSTGDASSGGAGTGTGDASGGSTGGPVMPPQKEVFFSKPLPGGAADPTIEDAIGELVDLAVPGSTVRVALYHWSRVDIAHKFVAASQAGVDVRVVLDRENQDAMGVDWEAVTVLKTGLGADRVLLCDELAGSGACIGTGINHNKFYLFSALADGSTQVVAQSSANMTGPQLHKHNNMVVIRGDAALYGAYTDYWDDLRAELQATDYYHSVDGDTGTTVYFYPRAAGDTIVGVLDNVTCGPGATIRVAMAFFTDARLEVAEKLASLREAGCDVAAIVVDDATYPGDQVLATLKGAGVDVTLYPEGPSDEGLHSKYLLIAARYAGVDGQRLLWTGSHNYTGPALRENDETLLKIDDAGLFDAFVADWLEMKSLAGTF